MTTEKTHTETFKGKVSINREGDVAINEKLDNATQLTTLSSIVNGVVSPFYNEEVEVKLHIVVTKK